MTSRLIITIVTRGDDMEHQIPGGFRYVDEMFDEAGLRDPISIEQSGTYSRRLRIIQRALSREFNSGIALRLVNPWSPGGLWLVFRHRLRDFPCILIAGCCYSFNIPIDELVTVVRLALTPKSPVSS